MEYYGFPVNNGEAVRLTLSIEGDEKEKIIQKVNDQGFKGCFVEDTSGESYKLYPSTINSTFGDADVFSSQNPMLRTLMIFYIVQGSFLPMIA